VFDFWQDRKSLVVLNLCRPSVKYSSYEGSCMIDAWDIEDAIRVYRRHNPAKKSRKNERR